MLAAAAGSSRFGHKLTRCRRIATCAFWTHVSIFYSLAVMPQQLREGGIEYGDLRARIRRGTAGGRTRGYASAFGSENHIPGWSVLPRAADSGLCRERGRIAPDLCSRSQAFVAASLAPTSTLAHTATVRGTASDPGTIRNHRRLGHGHFRTRWRLGGKASRRHSSSSGAVEFHAGTNQHAPVVPAAGRRPLPNAAASTQSSTLFVALFNGTRNFASGFFTTVLFLFFLLLTGDVFLHRLVEILPRFKSKRQVVEISQQIERDISAYLVTITIMNAAVGVAMALAMWLTGVGDPILWGTVAFLLNYVPILGTALGVVVFLLAGLLTNDALLQALLPAGVYIVLHLIEGETLRRCFWPNGSPSIPSSSSSRLSSGSGCGASQARSYPCQCSRLLRLFATAFGH